MDVTSPTERSAIHHCDECGSQYGGGSRLALCPRCAMAMAISADENVDEEEMVKSLFPELDIEGPIGKGGFGVVHRALHRRLKRPVALKLLDNLLARSAETRGLFMREMEAVGQLDHPGIVRAHDAGEREGHWYLITEFIEGVDTGTLVRRHGRLPAAEACEIVRQAALALHGAHVHGLVHHDVKPGNLMVGRGKDGSCVVKVLDFGLATLGGEGRHGAGGTPGYLAPEVMKADASPDARADVYSLGATLRRFLTGQPPHGEAGGDATLRAQCLRLATTAPEPTAKALPSLPSGLAEICDRCLAKDPAHRPQSAEKLAALLAPWCRRADLSRLLEKELPCVDRYPALWQRHPKATGWLAAGMLGLVLAAFAFSPKPGPIKAGETFSPRPVFSEELMTVRGLTPGLAPVFLTNEWETEAEILCPDPIAAARFLPDGRVVYLCEAPYGKVIQLQNSAPGEALVRPSRNQEMWSLAVDPGSGNFLWTQINDPEGFHLARADREGKLLPGVRFDYDAEFPFGIYEKLRKTMVSEGKPVADGAPWGLAVVQEGQVPDNTGLRAGDVLITDEGNRDFGITRSRPGLWKARADSDSLAVRLGKFMEDERYVLDVAVSRTGVFVLNRSEPMPSRPESEPWNKDSRLFRWDKDGFHRCLLRQPLHDPSGLAADPLSDDLYALNGALMPSASIAFQRVLRLHPVGNDEYEVITIAHRFGKFSPCGIAFSADGKRLLLTDNGNRVMLVLKRKNMP